MEVVILAGGLGTRLRSVVSEVPKCMAPVAGRPFLWYLLKYLTRFDVTRVVLSVGYLREVVFEWIDNVKDEFPFEFDYAVEEEPLGTGGGILYPSSVRHQGQVLQRRDARHLGAVPVRDTRTPERRRRSYCCTQQRQQHDDGVVPSAEGQGRLPRHQHRRIKVEGVYDNLVDAWHG